MSQTLQILENDAMKVLHSICRKCGKPSHGHRTRKGQFSFQYQRNAMPKNAQTTAQLHSSHTLVKQCSKFSKPVLSDEVLPDVQAGFRKARGTGDQIANIHWLIDKRKRITEKKSALLTMPKPLTMWITINCGKFFKRWEYQTT